MIKNKGKTLLVCIMLGLAVSNFAFAALVNCGGHNPDGTVNQCGIGDLIGTIRVIINFLLSWAWLVSVFMIVLSGFRMIFARGDTEAISSAKTSLTHAIVGFILILLSFVILNLVVGLITGGGNLNSSSIFDAFRLVP